MVDVSKETKYEKVIENFALLKKLGEGKFGTGWSAIQISTGKAVCVKILKDFGDQTQSNWEIELQAGYNNFNHENVLKMIGAGKNFIVTKGKPSK
jgi:hypothetical protein